MINFPCNNCNTCPIGPPHFGQGYSGDIETADILLLGEAPGSNEERTGLPFQGKSGKRLRATLEKYNFPMDRLVISNAVLCRPPDNKTPDKETIKACHDNISYLLNLIDPKFIIVTGNIPLKRITKKTGITKHRGSIFEVFDTKVFPIYHPAYIERNPANQGIWEEDIKYIIKTINGGETKTSDKKEYDYNLIESVEEFDKMLKKIYEVGRVSIDIETTGLRHWLNKIRSIQFSHDDFNGYYLPILEHQENIKDWNEDQLEIIDFDKDGKERQTTLYNYWKPSELDYIQEELRKLLVSDVSQLKLAGQNFKFDQKFLERWLWPNETKTMTNNVVFDTIYASYLLDENTPNDLKTNIYLYFEDMRGYAQTIKNKMSDKDEDENDFTKIKLEDALPYGIGDVDGTFRLSTKFSEMLASDPHSKELEKLFYEFYMKIHPIYVEAEKTGVGLDLPRLHEVKDKYTKEKQDLEDEILTTIGRPIHSEVLATFKPGLTDKQIEAKMKKEKFNLNSPTQLAKLLFEEMELPVILRTDKGSPSTNSEVLKELSDEHPFCRKVVKFKNRSKMISTYLNGALKEIEYGTLVKDFPMLHYTTNLIGAVTGRTSIKRFPVQTMPRELDVRSIICAPPGYYLVEWDLSQIELRLAAWYSQDPTMLKEFKDGIDIHLGTLIYMSGMSMEELMDLKKTDPDKFKELRKRAKLYNFGGLYRGGPKTLASHINEKLEEEETRVTVADTQNHLDFFFSKYTGLAIYYDKIEEIAKRNKQVVSCFGRVRRLPHLDLPYNDENRKLIDEALRQAVNSPIQGDASFLTRFAMIELYDYIKETKKDTKIIFDIHDAMFALVPDKELKYVVLKGKEFMAKERPPIMKDSIDIMSEASVFRNWKIPITEEELNFRGLTKEDLE